MRSRYDIDATTTPPLPYHERIRVKSRMNGAGQIRYVGECDEDVTEEELVRGLKGTWGGWVDSLGGGRFVFTAYCS